MSQPIHNIPTHLFLGFLGVGKTSAVLNCFEQKPANERWAVLVNEFGKKGIDGKIYQAQDILVKEVPGGCLCCAVGLPFQVAIMQILKQHKPDRLFIESSGASHAQGVIKTLQQDNFTQVLSLKANICIVTPNHLNDQRYIQNLNYQAQLNAADVLIVNKMDQASDEDLTKLDTFISSLKDNQPEIQKTSFGKIDLSCLDAPLINHSSNSTFHRADAPPLAFKSFGWDFSNQALFDIHQLSVWIQQADFIRAKGLVNTSEGWFSFNASQESISIDTLKPQPQGRIEIIVDKSTLVSPKLLESQLNHFIIIN